MRKQPKAGATERNPEAVSRLSGKHVRVLQRMLNYRLARAANDKDPTDHDFLMAEIGALDVAIAELIDLLPDTELRHLIQYKHLA